MKDGKFFKILAATMINTILRDLDATLTLVTHVAASLDKALYDDYLCLLAFTREQIQL